jgi:hypothetical protein
MTPPRKLNEARVYFHADNLSSAHVYLRLQAGQSWQDIPMALLEDCAQLTKANSIEGPLYNPSPARAP